MVVHIDIDSGFKFMIGALVLTILAFTWFFPTFNGAQGINNSSTLIIGGATYNWVIPLVIILIVLSLVMYYYKSLNMN